MNLLTLDGKVKKYEQIADIVNEYYKQVLKYQTSKKRFEVTRLRKIIEIMTYKIKFI